MILVTKHPSSGGSVVGQTKNCVFRSRNSLAAAALLTWMVLALSWVGGGDLVTPASRSGAAVASPEAAEPAVTSNSGKDAADAADTSAIKSWRRTLIRQCESAKNPDDVLSVGSATRSKYSLPGLTVIDDEVSRRSRESDDAQMHRCKLVVMDFGANVGDTMAHMMDAGLVSCDKSQQLGKAAKSESHFDQTGFTLSDTGWNRVTRWLAGMVDDVSKLAKSNSKAAREDGEGGEVGPEDYCYYGVEGNPVFSQRLKRAEAWATKIRPKPLRHAHFLTEHVGAGNDGPTQLYLDTINTKENFWGSSIFKTHQDVKKSIKNGTAGSATAAEVTGITISTLMKRTLQAFDPNAGEDDKSGGHLLLKVDIEGGEYPLVTEVSESGVLCDYVALGNRADLLIEFHSVRVTGVGGQGPKIRKHKERLEGCGVKFLGLQAWWH